MSKEEAKYVESISRLKLEKHAACEFPTALSGL